MDDTPRKLNGGPTEPDLQASLTPSRELPHSPQKSQTISSTSPSAAMAPSRSNTLSWQQRPSSRGSTTGSVRSRPLSVVASENSASRSPRPTAESAFDGGDGDSVSRSQIAQSLGAKDPTFFKQTQDRGLGSAAYRRNQVEDLSDTSSVTGNMRLPGMSRESTTEPEARISSPPESFHSISPSREGSIHGNAGLGRYNSSASLSSTGGFRSPLPTSSSQRFEPPPSDTTSSLGGGDTSTGRTMAMSPSQGRLSPERMDRPLSPTKGLGGFVQSAMMKRSDSVNKRWSAQAGPGLSRGNSVVSKDGVRFSGGAVTPLAESRNSSSRETTPSVNSRPTSSHSNTTITQPPMEKQSPRLGLPLRNEQPQAPSSVLGPMSPPGKRTTPPPSSSPTKVEPIMSPPSSPSKRWSPTKASWLENAISKPESPKVLSPAASQQPAWMMDINRAKQQRGSVDLGKGPAFKEVSIGGLVRSPPPGTGYKPPTMGGLPSGFSSGVAVQPRTGSSGDAQRGGSPEPMGQTDKASGFRTPTDSSRDSSMTAKAEKAPFHERSPQKELSNLPSIGAKTKPETPPKKDFRTTLKPRQTSGEAKSKDEPEFKNVFGKLKKTQTQNYVAPDEFKDNIMRGKAGLEKTGGPQKSNIKDEFKESILKKKEGMMAPSASTRITSASSKNPDTSTPEAIAKRRGLARSDSTLSNGTVEGKKPPPKPEALAKLQSLQEKPRFVALEKDVSAPAKPQQDPKPKPGLGGNFASSLAGILQRGPSPVGGAAKPPSTSQDDSAPVRTPAAKAGTDEAPQAGPQLTHATKGRARGPKRKAPTTVKEDAIPSPEVAQKPKPKPILNENKPLISTAAPKPQPTQDKSGSRPLSVITNNTNNSDRKTSQPNTPRKPSTTISKPVASKPSPVTAQTSVEDQATKPSIIAPKPTQSPTITKIQRPIPSAEQPRESLPPASTPQKVHDITATRDESELQQPLPSVKGAAAIWGQSPKPAQSSVSRSPVKLPTRKDEEIAMENAGLGRRDVVGLGIDTPSPIRTSQFSQPEAPIPATRSPKSPPLPGKKPERIDTKGSITSPLKPSSAAFPSPTPKRTSSPLKEPSAATKLFADVYDETPSSKTKINIDTQAVLDARSSNGR